MSQREFDRVIPPDEQLREVSLILMEALFRLRRHGPPPRPSLTTAPPTNPAPSTSGHSRPKRMLRKPQRAKHKPGTYANQLKNLFRTRVRQKTRFWQDQVVSIQHVASSQLERAVCYTQQSTFEIEFREAFDHAMRSLSPEQRRIASLIADRGMAHAAREVGVSWRQIDNALASMRAVFEKAGFDPVARPVLHHTTRRPAGLLTRRKVP